MKKLLFAGLLSLLSQIGISQQLESAIITNSNHSDYVHGQLIRIYDENISVVLSGSGGQYAFYLLENGNTIGRKVEITTNDTINDFCVLEDKTIYFCSTNGGCRIGHFSFDAFFQPEIIKVALLANGIDNISKIKAYKDPDDKMFTHVVAIGSANSHSIIIDLNDKASYPNLEYSVAASLNQNERWQDLDLDGKYVLTAGLDGNNLYLHHFYMTDLSYAGGGYFTTPIGLAYNTKTIFLQHLYDHKYAVVSDMAFFPSDVYTYCQIFDLATSPQITLEYERTIMQPEKNIIRDVEYSKDDDELLVLMTSGKVGDDAWKDYLVYAPLKQAMPLPMQVKAVFFGNYSPQYPYLNSVRMFKPYHYTIVGTEPMNNNMFLFAKDKTYETGTSCNKYDYINMDGSNIGTTNTPTNCQPFGPIPTFWQTLQPSNPIIEGFQTDCYSTH